MKSHYFSQHAVGLRAELGRALTREQMRVLHTKQPARHFVVAVRQFLILGLSTWGLIRFSQPLIWIPLALVQGFTIFNFTGMVPGSEKQPPGWMFSTSTNGITPYRGGSTVLSPVDIEAIPNLTWSRTGATIEGPAEISGFSVRTTVKDTIVGEYGSQVTRKSAGTLTPGAPADLKEARIGSITTPKQ